MNMEVGTSGFSVKAAVFVYIK